MQLGNVTLHMLSDGTYWEDGGGLFGLVPKALWQQVMEPDDRNRLPFQLRSLLIEWRAAHPGGYRLRRQAAGQGAGFHQPERGRAAAARPGRPGVTP